MRNNYYYSSVIPSFITELVNTPAMLRLTNIGMNCGCEYTNFQVFNSIPSYNRLEHSIGVALIIWNYTNNIEQTISGLFHDISTPVFSHTIDFMNGDYLNQESTELSTKEFVTKSSQIKSILNQYNIDVNSVCNYHIYPIADNKSPKLSADRLEYTLGNMWRYNIVSYEDTIHYYNDIDIGINEFNEQELIFKDLIIAEKFALNSLECSKIYVSKEDRYAMQILSEILSDAYKLKIINKADLYSSEYKIINMLENSELSDRWDDFRKLSVMITDPRQHIKERQRTVIAKKRYIDPYVYNLGRLSYISSKFKDKLNDFINDDLNCPICGI